MAWLSFAVSSLHRFSGLVGRANHSLAEKYSTGIFLKSARLRENTPPGYFPVRFMKTVPNGDGFLFAASAAVLTFLLPSHTEGWCFPPSEGERRPKDGQPTVFHPLGTRFPRSPFMTWPSKSATALWENAPPGHFLIPQGELRTAGASSPALPFKLGLRCEWQLYGTTASRVVVFYGSGAQCGSTTCFCGAHLRARAEREGHSHIA